MGLTIRSNTVSMEAAKHLSRTGIEKSRSIEKLSSGLRINRAAADAALGDLARIRSQLGSTRNQLESTFAQISAARINVKASESVIREVDFADEAANLSRISVLSKSGNFALSQSHTRLENLLNVLSATD